MTNKEIKQKAIKRSKDITKKCCNPHTCKDCEYGEYFYTCYTALRDGSCLAAKGYAYGFADGVNAERRRIYEDYQKAVKADREASVHGLFPNNVERFWQEINGGQE